MFVCARGTTANHMTSNCPLASAPGQLPIDCSQCYAEESRARCWAIKQGITPKKGHTAKNILALSQSNSHNKKIFDPILS